MNKKVGKANNAIQEYWREKLSKDLINFGQYWRLNRTKYVDGYTRCLYYGMIYKAVFTRSKTANFVDLEGNC